MFQQDWFLKMPANNQRQIIENEISSFNQQIQEAKNIQLKQRMIGLSEKTREEFYSSTFGNPLYSEQVKQLSIQTQKKFIEMQNCLDW